MTLLRVYPRHNPFLPINSPKIFASPVMIYLISSNMIFKFSFLPANNLAQEAFAHFALATTNIQSFTV